MRIAILSDIHGNRHALQGVLDDVDVHAPDEIWCLGDVVGYGADPNACCALVRERAAVALSGNHDLAVTGELSTTGFSRAAAFAADWTREALDDDSLEWLQTLRPSHERHGVALYHGSPREPVWEYVLDPLTAAISMDMQSERVACIGHTHVALTYHRPPDEDAVGVRRLRGDVVDLAPGEWLLNPGSVGQPRDGDPRAAWMLLDTDAATATWHRTPYDIRGAQTAIRRGGLPESLADRLEYGQ
jgi:predicted phosphodiesterase